MLQAGRTCPGQLWGSVQDANGEEQVSRHEDISAITARTLCSTTWMGCPHIFIPQFPSSSSAHPLAPLAPCRGSSTLSPLAAGLHAQEDTSGSCLLLGVCTSTSQPSIRPRAGGVTTQTHKPVGAATSSPQRRDSTAWGNRGADPKPSSYAMPGLTQPPSASALPLSLCLHGGVGWAWGWVG